MIRFSLFILSVALLLSCRAVKTSPVTMTDQDSTVLYLQAGEGLFLQGEQFNIRFDQVLEDSRCPEGVHCIWAGVAAVDLTVMGTYTRPQSIRLASTAVPHKAYQTTALFNGYVLRMLALDPYPSSGKSTVSDKKEQVKISVVKQP